MRRTELLQGLRLMKFEEIMERMRWRGRFAAEGAAGHRNRRLGKVSARRRPRTRPLYRLARSTISTMSARIAVKL